MTHETEPIEVTTRYATNVDSLAAAWAFVMEYVDRVGGDPSVQITPTRSYTFADFGTGEMEEHPRRFAVVVSGVKVRLR